MKSLVIAEKPSVAADLARALGRIPKKDDLYENEQWVITSAIGHLVELCLPGEMDKKRGKWSFANLPIIPDEFGLKPIEKTEARYKLLKRQMARKDVGEIINACDAGREGELIFRYLVQLSGAKKPIRRLWLQSMTTESIRDGFEKLRSDEEMQPLAAAAQSRSESDWLVGINSTRALTAFNSKEGGFQLTPAGRVQTPTLAILCEREEKIRAFKSRPYFEVYAEFGVAAGSYRGRWFDEAFRKSGDEDARAERLWDRQTAEEIVARCLGKIGIVEEEKKPSTQAAPLLYDLTTLQREANSRFSFSAKRTLQIAQSLYERHKALTYPRTDSRYLPEDNLSNVKAMMTKFGSDELRGHAQKALANGWIRPNKRVFNDARVTDHHAIIPTGVVPPNLDEAEAKIYDMVARRSIAVFYPPAQFEITTRITRVEKDAFRTDGKIITDPGWLAVYGKQSDESGESVTIVKPGETADTLSLEVKDNETKPPPRYTEATLLSAMEGAGKTLETEELREAMSQRGLGTPATRAQIIEGLILDGYIVRQARDLIATSKGLSVITLLRGLGVGALTSPEMTGEWEHKLKQMESSAFSREEFMREIRDLTRDIVEKARNFTGTTVDGNFVSLDVKCPKCGHESFKETYKTYHCGGCELVIWKTMAGRQLEPDEVCQLLREGRVGPVEGFRSKMGRPFAAVVKLDAEFKQGFDFGNSEADSGADFPTDRPIAACPVCKEGTVYDVLTSYCCRNAVGPEKKCTLRIGKTILQREIPEAEIRRILETGKSALLPKFISKKGKPFSAYLKLENGKVGFEFEPRKPSAKAGPKTAAKPRAASAQAA